MEEKKSPVKFLLGALIVALLAVSAIYIASGYTVINGKPVSTSVESLDLSDSGITDISALKKCRGLRHLDLRGNDISLEDYQSLTEALPECETVWSMPLGNECFDSDSARIALSSADGLSAEQLDVLRCDNQLVSFEIGGSDVPTEISAKLNQLCAEMPQCDFRWSITLGGIPFPADSESIVLPQSTSPDEFNRLTLFRRLSSVDTSGVEYTPELADIVGQLGSGSVVCTVQVAGKEVLTSETTLDVSGIVLDDIGQFSTQLSLLPKLERVEMCGCGQTDEQMEQLMAEHPDVKFVWTISFGRWKNIRTDIVCFSSLNTSQQKYDENTYAPLFKYCTDLVALDLGHSSIKDVTLVANLTKLQALILGDNKITDISPLAALQELEYLELWKNKITDISVLTQLPNLKDLNITYNPTIKDFEPLMNLPCIEKIWIQNSGFPQSLPDRLEAKYPDCMFSFYKFNNACGNGWCAQDRYLGIRKAFRNWKYVVTFDSWDNVTYVEGVTLLPAVKTWD